MNLYEYAEAINREIKMSVHANFDSKSKRYLEGVWFCCSLQSADIKDDGFLTSIYGRGKTANEAINDYAKEISGKVIIFSDNGKRTEYRVPQLGNV